MNVCNRDFGVNLSPTRETDSTQSCLDVFFYNWFIEKSANQSDITDRHTVLATVEATSTQDTHFWIKFSRNQSQ